MRRGRADGWGGGRRFDAFDLYGPTKFAGPVGAAEVLGNRRLCASIVGMWTAAMDTNEIGARLVIPEHVICSVLQAERDRQRGDA